MEKETFNHGIEVINKELLNLSWSISLLLGAKDALTKEQSEIISSMRDLICIGKLIICNYKKDNNDEKDL